MNILKYLRRVSSLSMLTAISLFCISSISAENFAYVSATGTDFSGCGTIELPCSSILQAVTSFGSQLDGIIVKDSVPLNSPLDLSGLSLQSSTTGSQAIISLIVSSLSTHTDSPISNNKTLNLSDLSFTLPNSDSTLDLSSPLLTSSYHLSLTSVSFSPSSITSLQTQQPLSFSLLYLSSGLLEADRLSIRNLCFISSPAIYLCTGVTTAHFNNLSLALLTLSGTPCLAAEPVVSSTMLPTEITVVDAQVTTICGVKDSSSSSPAFLGPTPGAAFTYFPLKVSLTNSSFQLCNSSQSTSGGVVLAPLAPTGQFSMTGCSCLHCSCSTDTSATRKGYGGFLYLDAYDPQLLSNASELLNFRLSGVSFEADSATVGRDIFVLCSNVKNQLKADMFILDYESPFNPENAFYGCSMNTDEPEDVDLIPLLSIATTTPKPAKKRYGGWIAGVILLSIVLLVAIVVFIYILVMFIRECSHNPKAYCICLRIHSQQNTERPRNPHTEV